ncbi:hypothetical protein D3C84_759340 [compost metagenome]
MAVALQQHNLAVERQFAQPDDPHLRAILKPQPGLRKQRHTQSAFNHFDDGFQFIQFQSHLHINLLLTQEPRHQASTEGIAVVAHMGMAREDLQRVITLKLRRHNQHKRFLANDLRRQLLGQLERRLDQDGQINLPGIDLAQQIERNARHQFRFQQRRLLA